MNQKWDVDWKMDCINYFKRAVPGWVVLLPALCSV